MSKPMLVCLVALPFSAACTGALWGNLMVLGITIGIFVGTLSLGRVASAASRSGRSAETSSSGHR
jgi:hypothetical protein